MAAPAHSARPGRELAQRRRVLFTMLTALAFRYPPGQELELIAALRQWLGGWVGIGRIDAGMARQSLHLQLTRYGTEGGRATFYPAGIGHSLTPPMVLIQLTDMVAGAVRRCAGGEKDDGNACRTAIERRLEDVWDFGRGTTER